MRGNSPLDQAAQNWESKVGQIGPQMGQIHDFFTSDFFLQSPGLIQFGANLTHFGPKSGHPAIGHGQLGFFFKDIFC